MCAMCRALVESFLDLLEATGADFTNCFRCLSRVPLPGTDDYENKKEQWMLFFLSQCATVSEMKTISRPRMDQRYSNVLCNICNVSCYICNVLSNIYNLL